jgi:hypothetical protein
MCGHPWHSSESNYDRTGPLTQGYTALYIVNVKYKYYEYSEYKAKKISLRAWFHEIYEWCV